MHDNKMLIFNIFLFTSILTQTVVPQSSPSGCYELKGTDRVLKYASLYQDKNKVAIVATECQLACGLENFTYAGRWNAFSCFCGNSLPQTKVADALCTSKLQIMLDQSIAVPLTRVSPIELIANSTVLLGNLGASITPAVPSVSGDPRTHKLYFGDVIGRSEVVPDINIPVEVNYNRPGANWLTLYRETDDGTPLGAGSLSLLSVQEISSADVKIECPKIALQGASIWCKASVSAGSHLYGNVKFGHQVQEQFSIPTNDGSWMRMSAARFETDAQACPANKFLVSGTSARYPGRLSKIDVHAMNTGSFTLVLLRVKCPTGQYEHVSDTCSTTDGSIDCQYASTNKYLLLATQSCVEPGLATCAANLRGLGLDVPATVSTYDYEVVQVNTMSMVKTGWQELKLPQTWDVQSGDRLGIFVITGDLIMCGSKTDYIPGDRSTNLASAPTVGHTITQASLTVENIRLELGAWLDEPREILLTGLVKTLGQTEVELIVEAYENGLSTARTTAPIYIDVPLNVGGLEQNKFETNSPAKLNLSAIAGRPKEFKWNFGDGTPEETTTSGITTHTYTAAGDYVLTVNLSNSAGFHVGKIDVIVRDGFQFTGIQCSDAIVGQPTEITLLRVSTVDLTCTWSIDNKQIHSGIEEKYTHTYTKAGTFTIEVTCTNLAVSITQTKEQVVHEAIDGLEIDSTSFPVGTDRVITFSFSAGSDITARLTIDGVVKQTTINYELKKIYSEKLDVPSPVKMNYELELTNPLGTKTIQGAFTFDIPLSGLSVTFEPLVSEVNKDITFRVSFQAGTSIKLVIDWGDGTSDTEPILELQTWPPTYSKKRQYASAGTYEVRFVASAGLQEQTTSVTVNVQGSLGTYKISPENAYAGVDEHFEVTLVNQGGGVAVLAQLTIDWGDGQASYSDRFVENSPVGHVYTEQNVFTLTATLTLHASSKVYSTKVHVIPAITNFGCQLFNNPIKLGEAAEVSLILSKGTDVTITASFETGQPPQEIKQPIAKPVNLSYTYASAGVYPIAVVAENKVRAETCNLEADVRRPIANMEIRFLNLLENYEGTTNIVFVYSDLPANFPSNLKYRIDWGDGTTLEEGEFSTPFVETNVTHQLTSLNYFSAHAILDNGVSSIEEFSTIGVFGRITSVAIEVTVASTGEPGYGTHSNRFAAGNTLRLKVLADERMDNVAETAFTLTYKESGHQEFLAWAPGNSQDFVFTQEGDVEIEATGQNPFGQASVRKTIQIGTNLRGLKLQLQGQDSVYPGDVGILEVSFEAISDSTCICITKSDTVGSLVYPAVGATAKDCHLCPSFTVNDTRPAKLRLLVPIKYNSSGDQLVTVQAQNPGATLEESLNIPITQFQCNAPIINLVNPATNSASRPFVVRSNEPTLITVNSSGNECTATSVNTVQWTVKKLDPESLKTLSLVNISDQPSATSLALRIPRNRLSPGFYSATVRVTSRPSASKESVNRERTVYIQSNYPPLAIQFLEGNPQSLVVGLDNKEICLQPELYSYDPALSDRTANQGFTSWKWYCAKVDEDFSETVIVPKAEGHTFSSPRTGCFGDGPGRINTTSGTLCFWSGNFEANGQYKMRLLGNKGPDRSGEASIRLEAKPGQIPIVHVRCTIETLCREMPPQFTSRGNWAIAQSDDLYLSSFIEEDLSGYNLVHTWQIKYLYPMKEGDFLTADRLQQFTTGSTTDSLRIRRSFFTDDLEAIGCKVCGSIERAGSTGTTCLYFTFLVPPVRGSCTLKNSSQLSCINCTGFSSFFGSLQYAFYLNSTPKVTVGASNQPNICTTLPVTKTEVPLCVRASDTYGNQIESCFTRVKVSPPTKEDAEKRVNEILGKDNMELNQLEFSGDLTTKVNLVTSFAEALEVKRELDEEEGTTTDNSAAIMDEKRNKRSEVAAQLVRVVATIAPTTAESMAVASSTISNVLANKQDVSRKSQEALIETIDKFANSVEDLVGEQSTETRQEIVEGVVGNALDLLEMTVMQIDDAVPLDVEKNPKLLDYDTDLDSPGLSGMGDEALGELSTTNNAQKQSNTASGASHTMNKVLEKQLALLSPMAIADEEPITTVTGSAVLGLQKISANSTQPTLMPASKDGSQIKAPNLCSSLEKAGQSCQQTLTFQSVVTDKNLHYFMPSPSSGIEISLDAPTVTLNAYNESGQIDLYKMDKPFEIILKKGSNFVSPNFTSVDPSTDKPKLPPSRIAADNTEVYQALLVGQIPVSDSESGLTFQLQPEDLQACPQYLVVVSMLQPPVISRTGGKYDFWGMMPADTKECETMQADPDQLGYPYTFFLNNTQLTNARRKAMEALNGRKIGPQAAQLVFVGYRQLTTSELNKYGPANPPPIPYPYRAQINNTAKSRLFLSTCVSTDSKNPNSWSSHGCNVGPLTTSKQTQCFCYHLSTFASGWIQLPNTLDFDYLFANMDFTKNPTLYATEIALGVLFLLLFIWARRKDLKDIEKLGVTPLAENNPDDEYLYEVIVSTGMRRGAGTDSRVCFMLSGEQGETDARVLEDPHRKVLQRGNCDRFLLACPRPMGSLIYCRLWHDNSGQGDRASWYCNYVGVVDLQTREKFHFLVERWLAVDEEDGQIDRLIPVSSQDELLAFSHMFATSISRDLSEDHLWLSVVARPAGSRFTRVERVATCMLLLFLSMLTSCMFYRGEGAAKQPDLLTIGPFALSAQEVFVAFMNNIITFVPSFIVTYMFRNSRLYTSHAKKLREAVEEHLDEEINVDYVPAVYYDKKPVENENGQAINGVNHSEEPTERKRKPDRSCPWQMRIVAWIFLIASLGVSVAFITFYGVSFGEAVCQKWLSSLFLSFFTSVLLAQPLKVIVLALFLSFACKNTDRIDNIEIMQEEDALIEGLGRRYQLQMDEEYMHSDYLMNTFKPRKLVILPPDPDELERARVYRLKQRRANDIIREILFYVIFLVLLLVITMSFRAPFGFNLKKHLEESFFGEEFTGINTVDDFYAWTRTILIPGLRAKRWYNRDPPLYMRGFLEDRTDRIIGYGMIRQLRVKPKSCNVYSMVEPVIKYCYANYDMFSQDEEVYGVGWVPFEGDDYRNNSMLEFQYTTSKALEGVPYLGETNWYSGGGYVHLLRGSEREMLQNLDFLESVHWIDFCTRALIVQFTVYNPNINLFAIVTVLAEKPGVGTIIPTYRIETANLFGTAGSQASALEIAFQVAYVLALLCYLVKEIRNLHKQKCAYFKEMWNYIEWFIIIGSIAAIAAYAYMIIATKEAIAEFSRTHGNIFMNFQFLAYWNEALTYLLAVICFFATMKLVRLFRFNQRVGLLGAVLRYAAHDLKYFLIVFTVIFMAFVLVFFLLYTDTLDGFRTFLSSVETSLQIILGKFDFTSMYERELVLGPLMFAVFTLCIIFIVISMFIAILDESFHSVMQDIRLQSDDHEMTQFILSQLVLWTGLNRTEWGRKFVGSTTGSHEPTYHENSERELNYKLKELNTMMDEFLGYVQLNYLADLERKPKATGESSAVLK